ncbi:DUF1656 domain-containing protein [Pokkaliibacter sp. CJK22405]|uniref:DUF1656 domain-containing protein n=1 Tax=Pokkaliibacter sp. CJK22405 TaxID=3384615 RepID=UPI0039850B7F
MIGELNLGGIFISPLLLCMLMAFFIRIGVSWLIDKAGGYRFIAQRTLFDSALFLLLTGGVFTVLRLMTTP